MSNYTPTISKTYQFEGDTVLVTFKRLSRIAMTRLAAITDENGNVPAVAAMDLGAEFLKEHVISFMGLKSSDGSDVTLTEMVDSSYFSKLQNDIVVDLFDASNLGENDAKNSGERPSTSTEAQAISGGISSRDTLVKAGSQSSSSVATNNQTAASISGAGPTVTG